MNKKTIAHLALIFANIFFAINLSAVKHLTNQELVQPFGLNLVRVGVSVLLFWGLYVIKPVNIKIEKKDRLRLLLCAITGIAINQLFFLKGLSLTYPIHAALLLLITPILIVFIAAWLLKERIGVIKVAGLTLGLSGALVLILAKDSSGNATDVLTGDIFIIINAISYTFYFILVKPLMEEYPPLHVVRWVFTFGFVMILPFGWIQFNEIQWFQFEWTHLASLSMIVFCGTFLAYSFNVFGIKHLGAGITGSYIYTQPVFAAIIAILFLHEQFTWEKLLAGILIFGGVFLVSQKTPPVVEE